jgi:acyl carrier protein
MNGDDNGFNNGLGDDTLSREVVDVICTYLDIDRSDVYRQSDLEGDFNVAGQDRQYLRDEIDDRFDISSNGISDDIGDEWRTVQDIISYVKSRSGE